MNESMNDLNDLGELIEEVVDPTHVVDAGLCVHLLRRHVLLDKELVHHLRRKR